jgi:hypothetical protein
MIRKPLSSAASQHGAALIAVIFLIVSVAALGAFAIRTGMEYQQQANLSLQEVRAAAAAYSGLEYAANRLSGGAVCAPVTMVPIPNGTPGMSGIGVSFTCVAINTGAGAVYEVTATARSGNFGNPDFVQRVRTRRIGAVGGGNSWQ